jgi:hypothetical protein
MRVRPGKWTRITLNIRGHRNLVLHRPLKGRAVRFTARLLVNALGDGFTLDRADGLFDKDGQPKAPQAAA